MKKDKYPLALGGNGAPGGPGGPDPNNRSGSAPSAAAAAAQAARDMYSSMNGYMPNGYHSYDPNMYSQYGSAYGRYDMYASGNGSAPAPPPTSSYMNGAYSAMSSMYGSNSPYGSSMQSMSPGGAGQGQQPSPGSVKSDNGASNVSMPSESPGSTPASSQPPSGGAYVKRESPPPPPPPTSSSTGLPPVPPGQNPQDLNRMISMYLPGDQAAAAAGDPNAQSRLQAMYAGHYQAMAAAQQQQQPPQSTDHLGHPLSMAHM